MASAFWIVADYAWLGRGIQACILRVIQPTVWSRKGGEHMR